eukprot:245181-Prymnesium_polylepis.1
MSRGVSSGVKQVRERCQIQESGCWVHEAGGGCRRVAHAACGLGCRVRLSGSSDRHLLEIGVDLVLAVGRQAPEARRLHLQARARAGHGEWSLLIRADTVPY